MNDKSLPKFVRDKIRLADNGDIYSSFTVANYYIDNKTLDYDIEKSNYYFSKVSEELCNADFRVKELSVFNYKRFKKTIFSLPKNNTIVLIGNNGSGKSTILEAIAKNLQFLSDNIRIKNNNNYKFHESEINVESKYGYSIIKCDLEVNNKYIFSCSLAKNYENIARRVSSELEQFKALGGMLQESDKLKGDNFGYPLLAYYPVERSITIKREDLIKKQENKNKKSSFNKISGHNKAFDGTSNFDIFFTWFKNADDILNEHKAKNSISADEIKAVLEKLEPGEDINLVLKALMSNDDSIDEIYKSNLLNQIEIVVKAIKIFLSDISDVGINRLPSLDMFVVKNNQKLSVFNLSQGEKTLLALVSDIARRLVILNPNLDNPLNGKGIVIIDELDLHLHPKWQQSIIGNLEKTFPNLQFIISTHSPLILTTVTAEQIKILEEDYVSSPDTNPYGKVSAEGLAIMDTPEKPRLTDNISEMLNTYEELVKSGQEESLQACNIKNDIEATGYTIDESQLELWRFIACNADLFSDEGE